MSIAQDALAALDPPKNRLRVDPMLRAALRLWSRHVPLCVGVALVTAVLDCVIRLSLQDAQDSLGAIAVLPITLALGRLPEAIVWAVVSPLTLAHLQGQPARLSASSVVRAIPAVLAAQILSSVFMGLGFALLVIPGIVVALMLLLAPAVAVLEHRGHSALGRSIALTRGVKLRLLLVLLGSALAIVPPATALAFGIGRLSEALVDLAPEVVEQIRLGVMSLVVPIFVAEVTVIYWELAGRPGQRAALERVFE